MDTETSPQQPAATRYLCRANLTTIGDDRKTALRRFERFLQQFVDEGLISGFSLDEPGDMEDDISEGVPATWMSEAEIHFESTLEWPADHLSEEEAEQMIELLNGEVGRIQARMAEDLGRVENVDYDYFNHDELTLFDVEPVESDPLWGASTTMRTSDSLSAEEARQRFADVLEHWNQDGSVAAWWLDPNGASLASDDGYRYSKARIYFRVSREIAEDERTQHGRELLNERAEKLKAIASEHGVDVLEWTDVKSD